MHRVKTGSGLQDRTAQSTLLRNTVLNIMGQALPLIIGLLTARGTLNRLGLERYAVLNLSWTAVGYFGLLDFGVGRAVTYGVAQRLAVGDRRIGDIVWPSFRLSVLLGTIGAVILILSSSWIASAVGHTIEADLSQELKTTLILLALSLPAVVATSILRGTLEAQQQFDLINLVRVPQASLMFLGPWLISMFAANLVPIAAFLLIIRMAGTLLFMYFVKRDDESSIWEKGDIREIEALLRYGAWVTVGAVAAPLLVNVDRFLIGGVISLAAVTYYTSAHDLMSRTWLVASSIMSVYFPAFTETSHKEAAGRRSIYDEAVRMMTALSLPLCLILVAFSSEILRLWLGDTIADHSANALRILGYGGFVAALALVPNMLLQATGKPKTVALVQLAELPIYIFIFFRLTESYGIEGAAVAWIIRVVIETLLFDGLIRRDRSKQDKSHLIPLVLVAGAAMFTLGAFGSLPIRILVSLVGATASGVYVLRNFVQRRMTTPFREQS